MLSNMHVPKIERISLSKRRVPRANHSKKYFDVSFDRTKNSSAQKSVTRG